MNCEVIHERIVTAAYGELPDDELHELERHLSDCAECQTEREGIRAMQILASAYPVQEPDPNLIARARMRLDEALDALPPRHWYERWAQTVRNGLAGLRSAPVAAGLLLVAGIAGGGWGGFEYAQSHAPQPVIARVANAAAVTANAPAQPVNYSDNGTDKVDTNKVPDIQDVASVSAVTRRPHSEIVDVSYNETSPRHVEGSLDDPAIRQLLMMAAENQASPRVRGDSVSLLADECRKGHSCQPSGIRDALIVALRYDENPAVREKALAGLEPYVAQDVRVRDAVLEALMNDTDPTIRTASIQLLQPVEADTSVRQVLYSVSNSDANPHIRNASREILSQVPEIQ